MSTQNGTTFSVTLTSLYKDSLKIRAVALWLVKFALTRVSHKPLRGMLNSSENFQNAFLIERCFGFFPTQLNALFFS